MGECGVYTSEILRALPGCTFLGWDFKKSSDAMLAIFAGDNFFMRVKVC